MEIRQALEEIEKIDGILPPFSADRMPLGARFNEILNRLRDILCPKSDSLLRAARRGEVDLSVLVSDVLLAVFVGLAVPCMAIGKRVAMIGIERFCGRPSSLIDE